MTEIHPSPPHAISSGLCEDTGGAAAALIARMAQGDARALEELLANWGPVFLGISQRMLGEHAEASKVVRETFVKIWRNAADYDARRSPPFVWAFAMLRELCIARLQRRRKTAPSSQHSPIAPPYSEIREDSRVMPNTNRLRLKTALDNLSPEERCCLETAVFLGYARSSMPETPDCPSSTVKLCLRRALDKLRDQLSRYEL